MYTGTAPGCVVSVSLQTAAIRVPSRLATPARRSPPARAVPSPAAALGPHPVQGRLRPLSLLPGRRRAGTRSSLRSGRAEPGGRQIACWASAREADRVLTQQAASRIRRAWPGAVGSGVIRGSTKLWCGAAGAMVCLGGWASWPKAGSMWPLEGAVRLGCGGHPHVHPRTRGDGPSGTRSSAVAVMSMSVASCAACSRAYCWARLTERPALSWVPAEPSRRSHTKERPGRRLSLVLPLPALTAPGRAAHRDRLRQLTAWA